MGIFAWVMMGLAIWHFTIWLPDHFWGGIVGALLGAIAGSILIAFLINGATVPGESETHLLTAVDAIPGSIVGLAAVYFEGMRRERVTGRLRT